MKRYLAMSAIMATSVFAASDVQILKYFKGQISSPDVKVNIVKREKLKENKAYELVTIKVGDGKNFQELSLFTRDDFIFPDIIDIKNKKSLLKEIEKKVQAKKLKEIYNNEDKKNIITLGNDPKKETIVIFSDPECPYCRQELKTINESLKEHNIKYLITPVHGKSSLEKAYLIYEQTKNAKTDKEKIEIMNKYYDKNVDISKEKVSDANVQKMEDLRKKYLSGAIKAVPFIINEKELH